YQGKALALFARNYFKAGTAVLLQNITSDYSMGQAQTFQREFTAMGGRILGTLNYKSDCKDFKEALSQVKGLDPDVLFVPGHAESGFVVKQAQTLGLRAKLLGGDGWPYREFYANGGQDLREGYYAAHWNKAVDTPKSQEFVAKYKKVYDVTDFAAISYDAAMVLFDAIRRARDTSPQAIRDALAETRDFEGATGRITFDATGDPVDKPVIIMKIANGRPTMLMTMTPGN
ncbi:MAG: ABC transporter substrate-binding protein, partial [Desulfovibrionaceae bacterium]